MDKDILHKAYDRLSDEDRAIIDQSSIDMGKHINRFGIESTLDVLAAIGMHMCFTDMRKHRRMVSLSKRLSQEKNRYTVGRHKTKRPGE